MWPRVPVLMLNMLGRTFTSLGVLMARPAAVFIVLGYAALWLLFDPQSLNWNGIAMLATWMMTLIIQRAEHRDTQAIHAKLDELLHAHDQAKDAVSNVDKMQPEEIEQFRKEAGKAEDNLKL